MALLSKLNVASTANEGGLLENVVIAWVVCLTKGSAKGCATVGNSDDTVKLTKLLIQSK